jgi:hypothetical protein
MALETRPTKYPEWASGTSGVAGQVEPTSTQKNMGWQAATAPPASYWNFLLGGGSGANGYFKWIKYLDEQIVVVESGAVSVYSLTANGATGASLAAAPAGTVRVTATGGGATLLPCPTSIAGTIDTAHVPAVLAYFQCGLTSPTFTWGYGVTGFNRVSTGNYQVVVHPALTNNTRQVTMATADTVSAGLTDVRVAVAWTSANQCTVSILSGSAQIDKAGFHFMVYTGA